MKERRLGVYHGQELVGHVATDESDRFSFEYDPAWLVSPSAFPISQSLPLGENTHDGEAAHSFFANLLPEGNVRFLVARRLGLSEGNDFALLAALGGECAGALVISPSKPSSADHAYSPLDEEELADLAQRGGAFAETSGSGGVRLSLAGAQDKLPVLLRDDRLMLPLGASASTHILKFASRDFKNMPGNEVMTGTLARASGLPVVNSSLRRIGNELHLIVERYDRISRDGSIVRLHQEDICQALGVPPRRKYEEEGGPTFQQCFEMIDRASSEPALDVRSLIRWAAFNAIVGNADGHAKNLSLVRALDGSLRLAPFYDLLSTSVYPQIAARLAMAIGMHSDPGEIQGRDWRHLAETAGIGPSFVIEIVRGLAETLPELAKAVAVEMREKYGSFPAADMILAHLPGQARRVLHLLKQ
jgi:serine/threonine-protein kinase HipA